MNPQRVLFVCLGNICRSPTAEATFRALVEARGRAAAFVIDSAGTAGHHAGEEAHAETRREASRRGVLITHRARPVTVADFARFDHLVAMDRQNQRDLLRLAKTEADCAKIVLFRSFEAVARGRDANSAVARGRDANSADETESPLRDLDVPDPWYTGEFARVYDICEKASEGLFLALTMRDAVAASPPDDR